MEGWGSGKGFPLPLATFHPSDQVFFNVSTAAQRKEFFVSSSSSITAFLAYGHPTFRHIREAAGRWYPVYQCRLRGDALAN